MTAMLMTSDAEPAAGLCAEPTNCREVGRVTFRANGMTFNADINDTVPFVSPDGLILFVGESVVVEVGENGELEVESHGPASDIITPEKLTLAAEEMRAALAAMGGDVTPGTVDPVADGRPENRLRLSLMQLPGMEETVLLVENGYGRRFDYRAVMQVPGAEQPEYTTTCELIPEFMVLEHWPHAIGAITLSDFRSVPVSRSIVCD